MMISISSSFSLPRRISLVIGIAQALFVDLGAAVE